MEKQKIIDEAHKSAFDYMKDKSGCSDKNLRKRMYEIGFNSAIDEVDKYLEDINHYFNLHDFRNKLKSMRK